MQKLDYSASGVNVKKGDLASKAAYKNAKKTFFTRKNKIGAPVDLEGGFAGVLDFGDFYLIQNDDGTGTKTEIAEKLNQYNTIGEDLLAMVADDAVCVGAEVVSLTNTFDVPEVQPEVLSEMTGGLSSACVKEKIVIPGGEIAEVPGAAEKIIWNATTVGVVKKEKFITGRHIHSGDVIIGLKGRVLRSNGISLARKICERKFGDQWFFQSWNADISWGEILLTPSKIFHRLLLETVLGDFTSDRKFDVKGLCHITGGGIPGNVPRILPDGLRAEFPDLHAPHPAVQALKDLGGIETQECYKTWHCGTAMMLFVPETSATQICQALNQADPEIEAKVVGSVNEKSVSQPTIKIHSQFEGSEILSF